jgi:TonB family protein
MGIWPNETEFRQKKWLHPFKNALLFLGSVVLLLGFAVTPAAGIQAGDQPPAPTRKLKVSVPPQYPELARRMNIQGVARVLLTVAPDGKVTDVKELGGNPVLVSALVQAVKKWRYEPADHESSIEVRFEFK